MTKSDLEVLLEAEATKETGKTIFESSLCVERCFGEFEIVSEDVGKSIKDLFYVAYYNERESYTAMGRIARLAYKKKYEAILGEVTDRYIDGKRSEAYYQKGYIEYLNKFIKTNLSLAMSERQIPKSFDEWRSEQD
jgi:hypothetical protein